MFPLTQQVPAHMREGGDEDEDYGGEGQGDIFRMMESGRVSYHKKRVESIR